MSESFPPPPPSGSYPPPSTNPPTNAPTPAPAGAPAAGLPVPGKTLGIVAFVFSFFIQLVGLILGIVAMVQSRKAGRGNGFALAAIVISIVLGLAGMIITGVVIASIVAAAQFGLGAIQECQQLGRSGSVTFQGQQVSCSVILDQYNRQLGQQGQ